MCGLKEAQGRKDISPMGISPVIRKRITRKNPIGFLVMMGDQALSSDKPTSREAVASPPGSLDVGKPVNWSRSDALDGQARMSSRGVTPLRAGRCPP
jgi:hypothetical protein